MPKLKPDEKKTTKPSKSDKVDLVVTAAVVAPPKDMEIKYPKLEIIEYSTSPDSEVGPVTPEDMKLILNWETEPEYKERMLKKFPESKPADHLFYDDFHCLDTSGGKEGKGDKVRCYNNAGNRPFDMDWCNDIVRMILQGQWSGPLTVPGETINGETIRISKYGRVLSGQHQGTALILADEWLQKSRSKEYAPHYDPEDILTEKYPFWYGHDHVVIETIIITGLSEDERVLRTIDYVKPRSVADMLFTMELYRDNNPMERKEMTRMLASAIDLLWTRTDAQGYRTHPEIVGFLERHKTLLECVQHIFIENKPVAAGSKKRLDGETDDAFTARLALQVSQGGRRISKLKLSAGQCAALCYLMATSATDRDDGYQTECPPSEKTLDFTLMSRARLFWSHLAGDRTFIPVRTKLNSLVETDTEDETKQGLGGRSEEKFAILAKAWEVFKDHPDDSGDPFPADQDDNGNTYYPDLIAPDGVLSLSYTNLDDKGNVLPEGKVKLLDVADFSGIDCPKEGSKTQSKTSPPPQKAPTPEQIEEEKKKIHEDRAKEDATPTKRKIVRK